MSATPGLTTTIRSTDDDLTHTGWIWCVQCGFFPIWPAWVGWWVVAYCPCCDSTMTFMEEGADPNAEDEDLDPDEDLDGDEGW